MKGKFIAVFAFLFSCQSVPSEKKADSVDVAAPTEVLSATTSVPSNYFLPAYKESLEAFLIPGASIYSDTTQAASLISQVKDLTEVSIDSQSSVRQPGEDLCRQYYFYEVTLKGTGTKGWVSGTSVLQLANVPSTNSSQVFTISGNEYQLYYLVDSGIGPSDENGLTGCNQYYIPFFFNEQNKTVRFIKSTTVTSNNYFVSTYLDWLCFISSDGGRVRVSQIEIEEGNIINFSLSAEYQEGGAEAVMNVIETDSVFTFSDLYAKEAH